MLFPLRSVNIILRRESRTHIAAFPHVGTIDKKKRKRATARRFDLAQGSNEAVMDKLGKEQESYDRRKSIDSISNEELNSI